MRKCFCAENKLCVKFALGKVSAAACENFGVQKKLRSLCAQVFLCRFFFCKNCSARRFFSVKSDVCKSACVPLFTHAKTFLCKASVCVRVCVRTYVCKKKQKPLSKGTFV